ncbi:MAG: hypothetical protein HY320_15965 [Armatimonadetes bacterium]|nr:hypothetical protein [Armatimonadota bacterium]
MDSRSRACPLTRRQIVDEYFLENRARLLEIAAFLDRLDRASDAGGEEDFRIEALYEAVAALHSTTPSRARRIQMIFSDPTTEPLEKLAGKGAVGVWDRRKMEGR